jgi:hypothetical protein
MLYEKNVKSEIQDLDRISWANIDTLRIDLYWAYLAMIITTIAYACLIIYNEFFEYIRVRRKYLFSFHHDSSIYVNTILVIDILKENLFIQEFFDVYRNLSNEIRQVWINRNYQNLIKQVEERENVINTLESTKTIWIKWLVTSKMSKKNQKKIHDQFDNTKHDKLWNQYLRESDREIKRLSIFEFKWLSSLLFIDEKINVIEHNLQRLSQLNLEIEKAQMFSNDLSLTISTFVQFHSQIASQLTCQSVVYHISFQMISHRMKIARSNIIWSNLCLRWWNHYARSILFTLLVIVLIFKWTFSMTLINFLFQITYLTNVMSWLKNFNRIFTTLLNFFLRNSVTNDLDYFFDFDIDIDTNFLRRNENFFFTTSIKFIVQKFYFMFLFVQIFLTISLLSSFAIIVSEIYHEFDSISIILVFNISEVSNYFFSYLLLQKIFINVDILLQTVNLMRWILLALILDWISRQKWRRRNNCFEL